MRAGLSIPNSLEIRPGNRFVVMVNKDMHLRPYVDRRTVGGFLPVNLGPTMLRSRVGQCQPWVDFCQSGSGSRCAGIRHSVQGRAWPNDGAWRRYVVDAKTTLRPFAAIGVSFLPGVQLYRVGGLR
jgi:hypothetical protein